jgi:uncharacterized protein (DUF1778 family)
MRNPTLRISLEPKEFSLISRAAETVDMSVESFVVMAALSRAKEEIADQALILLEPEDFERFQKAINNSPDIEERWNRLMNRKSLWEE